MLLWSLPNLNHKFDEDFIEIFFFMPNNQLQFNTPVAVVNETQKYRFTVNVVVEKPFRR